MDRIFDRQKKSGGRGEGKLNILYVALGGFFGAVARYFVANKLPFSKGLFPMATFFVNLSGSFILGILIGILPPSELSLFWGVGFLGSYTTFSTFKVEIIRQLAGQQWKAALTYMLLSYVAGILLAYFGIAIGRYL